MRIGIDIGGTKIVIGLVDESGTVTARRRLPTESRAGYAATRDRMIAGIDALLRESGVAAGDVKRIGIAAAGQVAGDTILFSPNLHWDNLPVKRDIEDATGIPTFLENDVNAATYGEWRFTLGAGPSDVVGIFIGTGIGGGLIFGRRLYRGFSGVGGEIGHMTLNPAGYRCNCGNTGCFESFCGGVYVASRVKARIEEGYRGKIWDIVEGKPDRLHAGHVEAACLQGDELCGRMWKEVIEYLGIGLQNIVNLLNPEVIICGGGVVAGTKYLLDDARQVMTRRAAGPSVAGMRIQKAALGEDAVILGVSCIDGEVNE